MNLLCVCPVGIALSYSNQFELISDVFDRKFFTFRSRRAPFEFIRRKNLDVREQTVGRDRLQRWLQPQREFIVRKKRRRSEAKDYSKRPCNFSHSLKICSGVGV